MPDKQQPRHLDGGALLNLLRWLRELLDTVSASRSQPVALDRFYPGQFPVLVDRRYQSLCSDHCPMSQSRIEGYSTRSSRLFLAYVLSRRVRTRKFPKYRLPETLPLDQNGFVRPRRDAPFSYVL